MLSARHCEGKRRAPSNHGSERKAEPKLRRPRRRNYVNRLTERGVEVTRSRSGREKLQILIVLPVVCLIRDVEDFRQQFDFSVPLEQTLQRKYLGKAHIPGEGRIAAQASARAYPIIFGLKSA